MNARRWILLCSIILALVSGGAALAFAPVVRAQAQQRALAYGIVLNIHSVSPSFLGVRLHNVDVSIPDIPALTLHFDSVLVEDHAVSIEGGSATVRSNRDDFLRQLQTWRDNHRPPPSSSPSPHQKTSLSLKSLSLTWPEFDGPESHLHLAELRVDDLLSARTAVAGNVELKHPRATLTAEQASLSWTVDQPPKVTALQARRIRAELRLDAEKDPPDAKKSPPVTPSIRDRLSGFAALAWTPLAPDAKLEVDAFEVLLHRGSDQVNIGPGRLAVQQTNQTILVDLAPQVQEGKPGITFRASLPMGSGPVILDLVGGPISLSTLGVQDTNLGLVDVAKTQLTADAHLKLHADGKVLSFDGKVEASNVNLSHVRLAAEPVAGLAAAAKGRGQVALDGSFLRIDEGVFELGKVQLELRGTVDRTRPKMRVDVHFGVPLVGCQDVLDALPEKLIPVVHGMTAAGTMSLKGHLRFDEENIDDFLLEYASSNDCRVLSVPSEVDVRRFRGPFKRHAYDSQGKPVEVESGPGTPGWVGRGGISHFMEAAVMTCEDGRFRRHQGFDHEAIRNSVRENLRAKKFIRGASTISMQLAKNLYLSREKTVSRKLQELILTTYLEQALTKDQIMELYLNVIEFGPMTYGLGPAANRYFNKHAASLSLGQAMYLASILPNPRHQHFVAGGRVSDGWMRYLHKLMKIAAKMRWITDVELDYGLGEWVVYGSPDPVRVEPEPLGSEGSEVGPDGEEEEPFGWREPAEPPN